MVAQLCLAGHPTWPLGYVARSLFGKLMVSRDKTPDCYHQIAVTRRGGPLVGGSLLLRCALIIQNSTLTQLLPDHTQ